MAQIQETAPARQEMRECAYKIFRNIERAEIFCAVPEDHVLPSFVVAEVWSFDRMLRIQDIAPPGFHNRGAQAGVRFNGFYIFYATARSGSAKAAAVHDREDASAEQSVHSQPEGGHE